MLAFITFVVGLAIIGGGAYAIWVTDRRWFKQIQQCVRCRYVWLSVERSCPRCQARGRLATKGLIPPHRYPAHDWQGHMNTAPIPIIRKDYFDVSK